MWIRVILYWKDEGLEYTLVSTGVFVEWEIKGRGRDMFLNYYHWLQHDGIFLFHEPIKGWTSSSCQVHASHQKVLRRIIAQFLWSPSSVEWTEVIIYLYLLALQVCPLMKYSDGKWYNIPYQITSQWCVYLIHILLQLRHGIIKPEQYWASKEPW